MVKIDQLAFYYIASLFWNKTTDTLKHINKPNIFEHHLKKHFLNKLKIYFHFQP